MKFTRIVSLLLALIFCVSSIAVIGAAASNNESAEAKITDELMERFNTARSLTVPTIVWFADVDLAAAETAALSAVEAANSGTKTASFTSTSNGETMENVQSYIAAKRNAAAELYTAYNEQIVEELFCGIDVEYISQYSPVVLVELTKEQALTAAQSDHIEQIGYINSGEDDTAVTYDTAGTISLYDINTITRVNTVHNSSLYGYTGEGVKIGVLEAYLPDFEDFEHLNIMGSFGAENDPEDDNFHANRVLKVISSIAPAADYYFASRNNLDWKEYAINIILIEWLMKQGVNVINASLALASDGNNTYGSMAKWLDHIAYYHDVHFVKSCGNTGSSGPNSGAMAYNILAVGNLNVHGTTEYGDDTISSTSSTTSENNQSDGLPFKPDICAPGQGMMIDGESFGGTSAAAPQVAGVIALLCEQRPALLRLQNTVKAILTASINFESQHKYTPTQYNYKIYGAGLLDAVGACWVTKSYRYTTTNYPAGTAEKEHSFTVTSSDTWIRVSLTWNIKAVPGDYDDDDHDYINLGAITNLNLEVIDPNGNAVGAVGSSVTSNNNVEIVQFAPTMTGTYTIRVTRADSSSETVYYALAWR